MGWKFFNSSGQLQTEAPIADGAITLAKIAHTNNGNDGLFLRHNGSSSDPTWAAAGGTITDLNDEADNRIVTFGSTTTELDGHEDWFLLRTVLHKADLFFQRASNRYDEFHRQNRRHDVLQIPQKSHDKGSGADQ